MKTYIALLRGINVGGRNRLPMAELKELLAGLGLRNVKTYIQSGNVVFQSEETAHAQLSTAITTAIQERHGFSPHLLLLKLDDLEDAMASNPFPAAESQPKSLHLFFLASTPQDPDLATLESIRRESEQFVLQDRVFYLHAPDGIGRSRLAARVERSLGVAATARNWRSVCAIMELAGESVS